MNGDLVTIQGAIREAMEILSKVKTQEPNQEVRRYASVAYTELEKVNAYVIVYLKDLD